MNSGQPRWCIKNAKIITATKIVGQIDAICSYSTTCSGQKSIQVRSLHWTIFGGNAKDSKHSVSHLPPPHHVDAEFPISKKHTVPRSRLSFMATFIDDHFAGTAVSNQMMAKKTITRGASFTPLEDEAIAKVWIAASEDPIVGAEQKGNDFFTKIQQLYNAKFKPANRVHKTIESVRIRCKTVHKQCMPFWSFHARICRSKPTEVSPNDIIKMATALYNGFQIDNIADDSGKPFKFEIAWRVL